MYYIIAILNIVFSVVVYYKLYNVAKNFFRINEDYLDFYVKNKDHLNLDKDYEFFIIEESNINVDLIMMILFGLIPGFNPVTLIFVLYSAFYGVDKYYPKYLKNKYGKYYGL